MRFFNFILFIVLLALASCESPRTSVDKKPSTKVDWFSMHGCSCYQMKGTNNNETPNGAFECSTMISDSSFILSWGLGKETLKQIPDTFFCLNRGDVTPSLVDEDENYLVTVNRCGSMCSQHRFLPLNDSIEYYTCNHLLDYDLKTHWVANLDYGLDSIKIHNLKSGTTIFHDFYTSCASVVTWYCIDSVSVKDGEFYLRWNTELIEEESEMLEIKRKLP